MSIDDLNQPPSETESTGIQNPTDIRQPLTELEALLEAQFRTPDQNILISQFLTNSDVLSSTIRNKQSFPLAMRAIYVVGNQQVNDDLKNLAAQAIINNEEAISQNLKPNDEDLPDGIEYSLLAINSLDDEEFRETKQHLLNTHSNTLARVLEKGSSHVSLMDGLTKYGTREAVLKVGDVIIKRIMEGGNDFETYNARQQLKWLLDSEDETVKAAGEEIVEEICFNYNLPQNILLAWGVSNIENDTLGRNADRNLRALVALEKERPGKGITELLATQFYIADFDRYPIELLVKQFDEAERTDLPYGVIFNPVVDHNGAYYQDKDNWAELQKSLKDKYAIRVFEVGKVFDVIRALRALDAKYGATHKISFAVVGGHGDNNEVSFGFGNQTLRKSHIRNRRAQFVQSVLEPNATIVFHSCGAGISRGVAQETSLALPGTTVIGPDKAKTTMSKIVANTERDSLSFQVTYDEEEGIDTRYRDGKKVSQGNS